MSVQSDNLNAAIAEYRAYQRLVIERPELGSWELAKKELKLPGPQKLWAEVSIGSERYLWFLGYMLDVFDRLIEADRNYGKTIERDIAYHRIPLAAVWEERWSDEVSEELAALVKKVTGVTQ